MYRTATVVSPPSDRSARALVVDLDGTLVRTDLLVEAIFAQLSTRPGSLVQLLAALRRGKAALKHYVFGQVALDVAVLPYDEAVLEQIRAARAEGRPVYLASATSALCGKVVADHVGLFDGWFASDRTLNLAGAAKAAKLVERFGEGGFDYIGNSRADCEVWKHSAESIGIRVPAGVARQMAREDKPLTLLPAERPTIRTWLRLMRVHQYAKNALIAVPVITSGHFSWASILLAAMAFVAFSLVASSIYIVNDIVDLTADRHHPTKCRRPLASGLIALPPALVVSTLLLLSGFAVAVTLSWPFTAILAIYLALTTSYSFYLKRKFLIDVIALSVLYTVRVVAGAVATGIVLSEWLLAFSMMAFTSLALIKRYVELTTRSDARLADAANRDYKIIDMNVVLSMAIAAGFNSITVLALYLASPQVNDVYTHPRWLWLLIPLMLYWIGRILMMAYRRQVPDDPIVFAMRDWVSRLAMLLVLGLLITAR